MKPAFNYFTSFALSLVNKVTTGRQSFVSVIANVVTWFAEALGNKTELTDPVKMRLISQLINGISKVRQRLLIHFNGTIISTFLVPSSLVWPAIFSFHSVEILLLSAGKSTIPSVLFKGYLCYKTIISQNVPSKGQITIFFIL